MMNNNNNLIYLTNSYREEYKPYYTKYEKTDEHREQIINMSSIRSIHEGISHIDNTISHINNTTKCFCITLTNGDEIRIDKLFPEETLLDFYYRIQMPKPSKKKIKETKE